MDPSASAEAASILAQHIKAGRVEEVLHLANALLLDRNGANFRGAACLLSKALEVCLSVGGEGWGVAAPWARAAAPMQEVHH